MNNFLILFLSLSISGSLLAIALFALKPLVKNRLRKSWQYYIWLVVLSRLLLPFAPETNIIGSFWTIASNLRVYNSDLALLEENGDILEIPMSSIITDDTEISNNLSVMSSTDATDINNTTILTNESTEITEVDVLAKIVHYAWIVFPLISIVLFTRKAVQYNCYVRFLLAGRRELDGQAVFEIYDEIRFETNVKKYIPIYLNGNINTPMLVGIIKPCIIMPETLFSDEEYRMIFRHELIHYKRCDVFYKWFTQLVVCVHWFNPLVYFIRREINKNCELACDETVLSLLGANEKLRYGDALMTSLRNGNGLNNIAVSITMSQDGKNLKERLESIMLFSNTSKLTHVLSCVLALAIVTGAFFLGAYYIDTSANAAVVDDSKPAESLANLQITATSQYESIMGKSLNNNQSLSISNDLNIEELYKLVYDEIKVTEQEFDNILSVCISTKNDNVKITKGGDKLFIRYGEWYIGDYKSFEVKDGELTLTQNSAPQYTTRNGKTTMSSDNWLNEYLRSKDKQRDKTVEIIIPESMSINIKIETMSGEVIADGLKISGDFSVDMMSGDVDVKNSDINGKLKINTMSGDANAENCNVAKDLMLRAMSGDANAANCIVAADLSVSSISGNCYVKNCVFASLNMSNISGDSKLILPDSAKNYDISYSTTTGGLTYNGNSVYKNSLCNSSAATRIKLSNISGRFSVSDVN